MESEFCDSFIHTIEYINTIHIHASCAIIGAIISIIISSISRPLLYNYYIVYVNVIIIILLLLIIFVVVSIIPTIIALHYYYNIVMIIIYTITLLLSTHKKSHFLYDTYKSAQNIYMPNQKL